MPPIHSSDKLEKYKQQYSLLKSELEQLEKDHSQFNSDSIIGFYGGGAAQVIDGASDLFLNTAGVIFPGMPAKIAEFTSFTKGLIEKAAQKDKLGIGIDTGFKLLDDKFNDEKLILKTVINLADEKSSREDKLFKFAGDVGSYAKEEALETISSTYESAKKLKDGKKTIGEGMKYRDQMNRAFEKRKEEIRNKMNELQRKMQGSEYQNSIHSGAGGVFQAVLERISQKVDVLVSHVTI
jgi:hypothetical protein